MKSSRRKVTIVVLVALTLVGAASLRVLTPGLTPVVEARQDKDEALALAYAAIEQAIENEKANEDEALVSDLAAAVDAAYAAYNELLADKTPASTQGIVMSGPTITPEVEPNGTPATATPLNLSVEPCAVASGSIRPIVDWDYYSFTAPANSRVWAYVDTGGTQAAGANTRDSILTLFNTNGTSVIQIDDNDGTGNGGDATIETGSSSVIAGRVLPNAGTYYLRIDKALFPLNGIIDPYRLFVVVTTATPTAEVEPNNTAAQANPIVTPSQRIGLRTGTVPLAGATQDWYSVVADTGDILFIALAGNANLDLNLTDARVIVVAPDGTTTVLTADSSGVLLNPTPDEGVNYAVPSAGTYYIRVERAALISGPDYDLMVAACGQPCVLTCPANVTANNDTDQCGAVVNYSAPTTTGSCFTVNCSPASGSFFPVGTTTVTCTSDAGPTCSFTVTIQDAQAPTITCPANVTTSTDPGQCSAVVSYGTPTAGDNCPGVTAACVPASGSTFPKGTTTVTCTATDGAGNTNNCSFTVQVNDTEAPQISCVPLGVIAVTPGIGSPCATVTFASPSASDNCPGVTVACTPPSGSCFPLGVTSVTCTATDTSGNTASTASCPGGTGISITVFNVCIQDDSSPNRVLMFNSATGDYLYCCDGFQISGKGTVTRKGLEVSLSHLAPDRKVAGKCSGTAYKGSASVTMITQFKCDITDRDTRNNTCQCGAPAPPPA